MGARTRWAVASSGDQEMSFMKLLSLPALALAGAFALGVSSGALADGRELFITSAIEHDDDTATFPLQRGTRAGQDVWYIVLDASDGNEAAPRGGTKPHKPPHTRQTPGVSKQP